jgi:hypothetical protein
MLMVRVDFSNNHLLPMAELMSLARVVANLFAALHLVRVLLTSAQDVNAN